MLASYGLFVVLYFLFTVSRRTTPQRYQDTLQGFQFLVLILAGIAIAQLPAQFIVDPRRTLMFFGIFPNAVLPSSGGGANTMGIIGPGGLHKSNGIFLTEASVMSQIAAVGILIEIIEFRRPRYLIVLTLGLLVAYTGTGLTVLLVGLPLAFLMNRRVQLPVLLIGLFACVLLTMGIIQLSTFTSRLGEFENTHASGFTRFVSPFWMAAEYFQTTSAAQLLLGNGPGGVGFVPKKGNLIYNGSGSAWFNLIYYYGLIGVFVFTCFSVCCFRKSRCPMPLFGALIYYQWIMGGVIGTPILMVMVVLCTLNGPEARLQPVPEAQYRSQLAGSAAR
jgi:hypothetical protein